MDFIFDEIPNHLDPFDYEAFLASPMEFVTGVTDADTGRPVYFTKEAVRPGDSTLLRASSSIPVFSPVVEFMGGTLPRRRAPPTRSRCRRRWTTAATGWSWC